LANELLNRHATRKSVTSEAIVVEIDATAFHHRFSFAAARSQWKDKDTLRAEQEREQLRRQFITTTGHLAGEPVELLFELAWFHEREDKPKWWAMFDRAERDTEELIDDPDSLGGLVAIGVARPEKKSQVRTYRYPRQETKLRETSKVRMKDGLKQVTVTRLDSDACEVDVKFGKKAGAPNRDGRRFGRHALECSGQSAEKPAAC
jgi:hypothetical protein